MNLFCMFLVVPHLKLCDFYDETLPDRMDKIQSKGHMKLFGNVVILGFRPKCNRRFYGITNIRWRLFLQHFGILVFRLCQFLYGVGVSDITEMIFIRLYYSVDGSTNNIGIFFNVQKNYDENFHSYPDGLSMVTCLGETKKLMNSYNSIGKLFNAL